MYRLFKAIKQANISVRKAFQIIDMDGSNQVSKTEMESAFRKIGIDISTSTIDYIFKLCDDDMNGTINCN
jgi:Ca2+-binding EF-hand superfamily protein